MGVNSKIFKAYDIRGIYPGEINGPAVYEIGRAFVKFLRKVRPVIAIGRDGRLSSPILHKNLVKGLADSGAKVIDAGLSPTPALYWASARYNCDGGIEITASHNPKEYNGLKLVRGKAVPIGETSGLKQIQALAQKAPEVKKKGTLQKKKIIGDYVGFNLKDIKIGKLKPLKVAVDTANAVPGLLFAELSKKISCKIFHLFKKLDGSFPGHSPDPLIKENIQSLVSEVKKKKADFGAALDGDGDRIIFIDEKGGVISSDMILAMMADFIIKKNPGAKILYDIRCSKSVKEVVEENGGLPVIWRVGHSFIKEKMRKENILFGGELSGHFYYQKHHYCEAPLFVLLKIMEIMSETGKTLSQLISPYQRYFHSGEINFKVEDKSAKIRELKRRFKDGKILEIDGLRADFKNWWFSVRPSNTEPLLRLVLEAKTEEFLEEKKKELSKLILA